MSAIFIYEHVTVSGLWWVRVNRQSVHDSVRVVGLSEPWTQSEQQKLPQRTLSELTTSFVNHKLI